MCVPGRFASQPTPLLFAEGNLPFEMLACTTTTAAQQPNPIIRYLLLYSIWFFDDVVTQNLLLEFT
jgi:hypothetical protein